MARSTRLVQSASVLCMVNGRPYGVVTAFQWNSTTPKKEFYGLDSVDPFEIGATITKITGTISVYRTNGDGGAEGWGLATTYDDLSREKYFSLMLVDRATDRVLFQADYCSVTSQAWNVPPKGVITGQIQFTALTWNNEVRPLSVAS